MGLFKKTELKIAAALAIAFIGSGFSNQVPPHEAAQNLGSPATWEQKAKAQRDIASVKFPMLSYKQVKTLPSTSVYKYYKQLHKLMAEMEKFQLLDKKSKSKSKKVSALLEQLFLNTSNANTETLPPYTVGTACLIGGYWGTWTYRRDIPGIANRNGMTCISENRCALPGDQGGTLSGHKCNPKYFTYSNAESRGEWCVNLRADLTANGCIALLEERYQQMCDSQQEFCRPFADHFRRGLLQAIQADASYSGMSEEDAINRYRNEVFTEFARIRAYCGDTREEWDRHSAGQQYSCFNLMQHYEQLERTVAEIAPPQPPAYVPPVNPAPPADNNGLGRYACVKQGLVNAGYSRVSNRYIAMFAVRSKDQIDNAFLSFLTHRNRRPHYVAESTILSIASVGICENLPELSADEARRTQHWLGQDKLDNLSNTEFGNMFGVEKTRVIPNGGWKAMTYSQRRSRWNTRVNNASLRSCPTAINERESIRICKLMHQACGMNDRICDEAPDRDGGGNGGDNNGSNNGNTNGGGNNGSNNGGGRGETGSGSNAESGHGGDNGGGHGDGPG